MSERKIFGLCRPKKAMMMGTKVEAGFREPLGCKRRKEWAKLKSQPRAVPPRRRLNFVALLMEPKL